MPAILSACRAPLAAEPRERYWHRTIYVEPKGLSATPVVRLEIELVPNYRRTFHYPTVTAYTVLDDPAARISSTCEGEQLSFRNGAERVAQDCIRYRRRVRHRRRVVH